MSLPELQSHPQLIPVGADRATDNQASSSVSSSPGLRTLPRLTRDRPTTTHASIRIPALIGSSVTLFTLLSLVAASIAVPLASAVIVTGTVVVDGNIKTLQSLDGGYIKSILVHDGQEVQANETVIQLDTTRLSSVATSVGSQLALLAAKRARLHAELDRKSTITFPEQEGGIRLADYTDMVQGQRDNLTARQAAIRLRLEGVRLEEDQDRAVLGGLQHQVKELDNRLALSSADLSSTAELAQIGDGTRKAARDANAFHSSLVSDLVGLRSRCDELVSRIAREEVEAQRVWTALDEEDQNELQLLAREEPELLQRLYEALAGIARAEIRTPVTGKVFNLSVHTVGGVVAPGASILDVVPTGQPLIIEAEVKPVDRDDVKVGSMVSIRLEGQGAQRQPLIPGRVTSVSADRIVDHSRNTAYFLVRIEVDRAKLLEQQGVELKPGISVEVMIAKGRKTVLAYLTAPVMQAFSHVMTE